MPPAETANCPACDAPALQPLYQALQIPVQSNLLALTREEAAGVPRGNLELVACRACGFMANPAFDPSTQQRGIL